MAIFGKSRSASGDHLVPVFDDALDDHAVIHARQAARGGDPDPARELLAVTGTDWARRQHRVHVLSEVTQPLWLDRWLSDHPDDPTHVLLRGVQEIILAWKARGSGLASTVTAPGWEAFHRRIGVAEELLLDAAEKMPRDPTPWSFLAIVARAQGRSRDRPLDRVRHMFDRAIDRDRWHFGAHSAMQTALYEKWLGDRGMALSFTREASATAAPGDPVHALLPLAHWEEASITEAGRDHLRRADVRAEVFAAHARRFPAPAGSPSTWDLHDGNVFAIVFILMHEYDRARAEFERIGTYAVDSTWARAHQDPARAFRKFRELALEINGTSKLAKELRAKQAAVRAVDSQG
jgi:hypothetical protein